jgi:hypothetical protein
MRLEGPGSEQRLQRLRTRFQRVTPKTKRRVDRSRVGMTIWLMLWATSVGVTLYLLAPR